MVNDPQLEPRPAASEYFVPLDARLVINGDPVVIDEKGMKALSERSFLRHHARNQMVANPDLWSQLSEFEQQGAAEDVILADQSFTKDNNRFDFRICAEMGEQLPFSCLFSSQDYKKEYAATYKKKHGTECPSSELEYACAQQAMIILAELPCMNAQVRLFVREIASQDALNDVYMALIESVLPAEGYPLYFRTGQELQKTLAKCGGMTLKAWAGGYFEVSVEAHYDEAYVESDKIPGSRADLMVKALAQCENDRVRMVEATVSMKMTTTFQKSEPVSATVSSRTPSKKTPRISRLANKMACQEEQASSKPNKFPGRLGASEPLPDCISETVYVAGFAESPLRSGRIIRTKDFGWVATNLAEEETAEFCLGSRHAPPTPGLRRIGLTRLSGRLDGERGFAINHRFSSDGWKKLCRHLGIVVGKDQVDVALRALHEKLPDVCRRSIGGEKTRL